MSLVPLLSRSAQPFLFVSLKVDPAGVLPSSVFAPEVDDNDYDGDVGNEIVFFGSREGVCFGVWHIDCNKGVVMVGLICCGFEVFWL